MSEVLIDARALIKDLEAEITTNEKERDNAVKSQWFETAAKKEVMNQGLKSAIHLVKERANLLNLKSN